MTPEEMKITKRWLDTITLLVNKNLLGQRKTWVKVGAVKLATGWTKVELRTARESGLVEYREKDGDIEYCLESIPDMFIKRAS